MNIYDLYQAGKTAEATAAQLDLARAEWGFGKGGINGTKWVVARLRGYPEESSHCRRPYPKYDDEGEKRWIMDVVEPLMVTEKAVLKRAQ